ncbi:MAG: BTAD domain-containing putative transcriptional regulator, partial [Acidimicrobiales bacterium]
MPRGEPGELCSRGYAVMLGYWDDPARTAEAIDGEGRVVVLDRALACWRGNALMELADLPLFEAEARRLDALRGIARERRAEALLAVRRAAPAIPDLEALLVEEPQREHARALLMDALSIEGRQTDALTLYEHWRRHLIERGLEPSPELREAEVRVLLHRQRATRDRPRWFSLLPRPTSSLVGRDDDVAA